MFSHSGRPLFLKCNVNNHTDIKMLLNATYWAFFRIDFEKFWERLSSITIKIDFFKKILLFSHVNH